MTEHLDLVHSATSLRPFWRYYGGKWRAAPLYPQPRHDTIVEPFAGSAGYSLRYADLRVVLVDRYPAIAEMWRFLIAASRAEILSVPLVDHVDDLPPSVCAGARLMVRWCLGAGNAMPVNTASAGVRRNRELCDPSAGWSERMRERIAKQVDRIKHWTIIEGDYTAAPRIEATWYVDPPYNNSAGEKYRHGSRAIDYDALGHWCRDLPGQVIVCENVGATWLPFQPFGQFRRGFNNADGSREAIWLREESAAA